MLKNLIFGRIAALRGARNPHVLNCTFRFLRAACLALHPKSKVFNVCVELVFLIFSAPLCLCGEWF